MKKLEPQIAIDLIKYSSENFDFYYSLEIKNGNRKITIYDDEYLRETIEYNFCQEHTQYGFGDENDILQYEDYYTTDWFDYEGDLIDRENFKFLPYRNMVLLINETVIATISICPDSSENKLDVIDIDKDDTVYHCFYKEIIQNIPKELWKEFIPDYDSKFLNKNTLLLLNN